MKKVFITVAIISCLMSIIVIYTLLKIYAGYKQDVATICNIKKEYYNLIENEFNVKLPDSTVIEEITLVNGKDTCLNVRISLNKLDIDVFNQSIGFTTEQIFDSKYEKIIEAKDTESYIKIRYLLTENSKNKIDLVKYDPIGKLIYDIFKNEDFHPIKSR